MTFGIPTVRMDKVRPVGPRGTACHENRRQHPVWIWNNSPATRRAHSVVYQLERRAVWRVWKEVGEVEPPSFGRQASPGLDLQEVMEALAWPVYSQVPDDFATC